MPVSNDTQARIYRTEAGVCIEGCGAEAERGGLWCEYHHDLLSEGNRLWRESFYNDPEQCLAGYKAAALETEFGPSAEAAHTNYPVVGGL